MCTHRRCPLNLIIPASFEWREVDNQLRSFGVHVTPTDGEGPRAATYRAAVALAHEDMAFSKHLTRLLCTVHSRAIETTRATPIDTLRGRVATRLRCPDDVPDLWALVVDRRPETSRLAWSWLATLRASQTNTTSTRPTDS